jgi:hypothetical protein
MRFYRFWTHCGIQYVTLWTVVWPNSMTSSSWLSSTSWMLDVCQHDSHTMLCRIPPAHCMQRSRSYQQVSDIGDNASEFTARQSRLLQLCRAASFYCHTQTVLKLFIQGQYTYSSFYFLNKNKEFIRLRSVCITNLIVTQWPDIFQSHQHSLHVFYMVLHFIYISGTFCVVM